ncbi:hypothetical protein CAL7716_043800 [Calothrix sp. PCC 7716]|nr:hypothetical protein CAL7716_043800 [Calothrix sp. PCC 7716]
MEQTSIVTPVTIKDLMEFTLIELFPLKEPGFPLQKVMLDWKKKKGILLEYAKTKHYIFFDVDNACIRVMPLSFDGGFMPHERMMSTFPLGFNAFKLNSTNMDYTLFVDTDESKTSQLTFTFGSNRYSDVVFVGKQFNNSVAALTLSEVIDFLANTNISQHYECVMVYPPA